ncbi:restriction endonuclease subunit S [Campylobacter coli]
MKNFKDSGIEWLGEIPEHWKLIKCKNFFVLKSIPIGDLWNKTKLLSLTLNGVIERDINNPEGKFPSDFSTYQIVKEGDLIFCLFDVAETPRTIGLSKLNGMITSAYTIFEIKNQEKRFLEYFFIDLDNRKNLKFLYRGLRNTISKEDLLNLKIPLPPLKEQEQIANFLDEKCEQIKNFIEKKEKLITLLKEQKQAFINKATTKGLDKNINFKDSGIEWLGEIPQHWEVKKLKMLFTLGNGLNITKADFVSYGIPCVSYGEIHSKYPCRLNTTIHTLPFVSKTYLADKPQSLLQKGDFVFVDTSEDIEGSGNFTSIQSDTPIFAGYHTIILKYKGKINSLYFSFLFDSIFTRNQIRKEVCGVKVFSITKSILKEVQCLIPPLKEQEQIANFLDEKCEKIDLLIEKTKKQIKLIKEYKTTLINQAVCGRINL